MNSFLEWLGLKLFGRRAPPDESLHQSPPSSGRRMSPTPRPARPIPPTPPVDYSATVGGKIEDGGPGKNVLIRNRLVREDTGTHDTLKILDDSVLESEEEFGLDPYNTGRFDRSKSWDTRNRK